MDETHSVKTALDRLQGRHISSHLTPYYTWIRHVIALSLAALTALISLQASYLPSNPQLPIFLAICWGGLLCAVLLGTYALAAEHRLPLSIAERIQRERNTLGDCATYEKVRTGRYYKPSRWHRWAVRLMAWCFAFSLCSLFAFATINLLTTAL